MPRGIEISAAPDNCERALLSDVSTSLEFPEADELMRFAGDARKLSGLKRRAQKPALQSSK